MPEQKLKIGVFSVTGCAGCQLSLIFNEDELSAILELVDLCAFPFIKERECNSSFDIVLMEGLVATNEDLETLKKIRNNTKKLVALGACAHTGCIPAYKNFTNKKITAHTIDNIQKNLKSIAPSPLSAHVQIDYTIPGCPPDKKEILSFIYATVKGIEVRPYIEPVCFECRMNGNTCLLEKKKMCLGPITRGGCNAVCPNGGFECWGCRGKTDDANIKALYDLLKKNGFSKEKIKERMRMFAGSLLPQDLDTLF